jgi:D-alanyl-D-alanine carboxypeptidase
MNASRRVHARTRREEEQGFARVESERAFTRDQQPTTRRDARCAYAGANGIKTGHTSDAGWCILASATREGRRIVVGVLGAPTEEGRDDAAQMLLDWGFAQLGQTESGTQPEPTDSRDEAPDPDSDGVPPGPPLALDLEWPASGRSAAAGNLGRAHHARQTPNDLQ